MESKRDLYKQRSRNGLATRESRARLKERESKSGREALLLAKRRIPLSALQEETKRKAADKKSLEAENGETRLQKLLEWKKKRDELKRKKSEKKPKPFILATSKSMAPQSKSKSVAPQSSTGVFGCAASFATRKKDGKSLTSDKLDSGKSSSISKVVEIAPSKQPTVHTVAANTHVPQLKPPAAKLTSKTRKPATTASRSTPPKKGGCGSRGRKVSPPASTRNSKRIADKNIKKMIPSSGKETAVSKNNVSAVGKGVAREVPVAAKEGRVTRSTTKKAQFSKLQGECPSNDSHSTGKKKAVSRKPLRVSSDPAPNHSPSSPPPPSSLPLPTPPPPVHDPTWILNACVAMFNDRTPRRSNFDEVFGMENAFSPFHFSGANQGSSRRNHNQTPFTFTFKKSIPNSPLTLPESDSTCSFSEDSLNCDPISVSTTTDTGSVKMNVGRSDTAAGGLGVEAWRGVTSEGGHGEGVMCDAAVAEGVNSGGSGDVVKSGAVDGDVVVKEKGGIGVECACEERKREEEEEEGVCPVQEAKEEEDEVKNSSDFLYFQKLHSDTCDVLNRRCAEWTEKSQSLEAETEREEDEERRRVMEDVIDQIRAAIGQSQLLMKKKLTQYLKMVLGAHSGETHTSPQDIQGYWDLVYIQVEELYKRFKCLEELERNNWQQPQQNGMLTRGKAKKRVAPLKKAPQSEKQIAAREKREGARLRLREMRLATARRGREGNMEEEGGKEGGRREGCPEPIPEPHQSAKKVKNEISSDDSPVVTTPTSKVKSGSHDNQQRKSSRRKSRVSRRQSESLICFSMSAEDTEGENMPSSSSTYPSIFSPPRHAAQLTPPNVSVEVPTANLLNFDTAPTPQLPLKSPCKWTPHGLPVTPRKQKSPTGASVRRFVSITPSKRVRDQFDADIFISPARRSLRNIGCTDKTPSGHSGCYTVSSLLELPEGINLAYCPNKALL